MVALTALCAFFMPIVFLHLLRDGDEVKTSCGGVFLFVILLFFTLFSFANSVFPLVVEAISALHLTVP